MCQRFAMNATDQQIVTGDEVDSKTIQDGVEEDDLEEEDGEETRGGSKRRSYTVKFKIDAIETLRVIFMGNKSACAKHFKVTRRRIQEWCRSAHKFNEIKESGQMSMKRIRPASVSQKAMWPDLEKIPDGRRSEWQDATGMVLKGCERICSLHFKEDDIRILSNRKILKHTALPTVALESLDERSMVIETMQDDEETRSANETEDERSIFTDDVKVEEEFFPQKVNTYYSLVQDTTKDGSDKSETCSTSTESASLENLRATPSPDVLLPDNQRTAPSPEYLHISPPPVNLRTTSLPEYLHTDPSPENLRDTPARDYLYPPLQNPLTTRKVIRYPGDIPESSLYDPIIAEQSIRVLKRSLEVKDKKMKFFRQKCKRLTNKVHHLQDMIKKLNVKLYLLENRDSLLES